MTSKNSTKTEATKSTRPGASPPRISSSRSRVVLPELSDGFETTKARAILLNWYDQNQRQLPWRGINNPWATWVSEIMLQQTRVSSVLEYFDRFMSRFPTPRSLAEAEWDEVAQLWAGLGYYRRAKNLWRGAKDVVARHDGKVPSDEASVRALTGVGPYTAGAILSIAFGQHAPLVDGNVARVFSRLYRVDLEQQSSAAQKLFWGLAEAWVQGERPGDFNQALMELGATVCLPKSPTCLLCPMRAHCRATRESDPTHYPVKKSKKKTLPCEDYIALLVSRAPRPQSKCDEAAPHEYLVLQREGDGLLGGMWGLPHIPRAESHAQEPQNHEIAEACQRWISQLSDLQYRELHAHLNQTADRAPETNTRPEGALLLTPTTLTPIEVTHRFTHKRWRWWIVGATLSLESSEDEAQEPASLASQETPRARGHERSAALRFADASVLDLMALGGPSLKGLRAAGVPLRARRGSGR